MKDGGHIVFVLSLCHNFNIRYDFWTLRVRLHIWHVYSANDALSNDNKVNDIVAFTFGLMLKKVF